MTSWSEKMKARLAARAADRLPAKQPEKPRKLPVSGPPAKRPKAEKKVSTKDALRILNLASAGGAFDAAIENFRTSCRRTRQTTGKLPRYQKALASDAYREEVNQVAAGLVGRDVPELRIAWSNTQSRTIFRRKK